MRTRITDAAANDRVERRDALFLSDGVSFVENGGRMYERFCEPVMRLMQARGMSTLLLTPSHRYMTPRATPSVFVQPAIDVANVLAGLTVNRIAADLHLPEHAAVRRIFRDAGLDHGVLDERKIASDVARVVAVQRCYDRILDRVRPKIAFIVSYYSIDGMGFILACQRRGIPVVDLQHGVQGALHPAYGRFPRLQSGRPDLVPDLFWVWSEEEHETIREWAADSGHDAVVGGNVWMHAWMEPNGALSRTFQQHARQLLARSAGRKVVLVTLQWGLPECEQTALFADVMRGAGAQWMWWVRLHPVMLNDKERIRAAFAGIAAENLDIDDATALPLYGLLQHVDVHLTHSSSTVIEAANFGVRSIVTSPFGAELYPQQIEHGQARLATEVHSIAGALEQQASAREGFSATGRPSADQAADILVARASKRYGT